MAPIESSLKKEDINSEKPKRRVNKPLIEKRRRERINDCLNQLQGIVALRSDKDKYKLGKSAKLEKADILEMTVDYLKRIKQEENDVKSTSTYVAGFQRCLDETNAYFKENSQVPKELKDSIIKFVHSKFDTISNSSGGTRLNPEISETPIASTLKTEQEPSVKASVSIQPKTLQTVQLMPNQAGSLCLSLPQMAHTQPTNQIVNSSSLNQPMTFLCNRDMPTFVLIPTTPTVCQPLQSIGDSNMAMKGLQFAVINPTHVPNLVTSSQQVPVTTTVQSTMQPMTSSTMLPNGPCFLVPSAAPNSGVVSTSGAPLSTVSVPMTGTVMSVPKQQEFPCNPTILNIPTVTTSSSGAGLPQDPDKIVWRPW